MSKTTNRANSRIEPTAREVAQLQEGLGWTARYPNLATRQGLVFDRSTSLVIAHPDDHVRLKLAIALRGQNWTTHFFKDGFGVLAHLAADLMTPLDCPSSMLIIADAQLPGHRGLELLTTLRQAGSMAPFILLTPQRSRTLAAKVQKFENVLMFETSFDNDDLLTAVCYLLGRSSARGDEARRPAVAPKARDRAKSSKRTPYPSRSGIQSA